MKSNDKLRAEVLGSIRVAMLGMVKPNLRSVLTMWNENSISVRFVFDEDFSSDDLEDVSIIEAEMIAYHDPDLVIRCVAESIPATIKVELKPGELMVFQRAENRSYLG